jgi:hypothetical protein
MTFWKTGITFSLSVTAAVPSGTESWGAMGFFGDFRGRTIPNFFNGHGTNSPELSAGLTFSWGEK